MGFCCVAMDAGFKVLLGSVSLPNSSNPRLQRSAETNFSLCIAELVLFVMF